MQLIVYFINSFKVNEKEIYFSPQYSLNLFTAHQEQKKRGFYLRTTLYYKTLGSEASGKVEKTCQQMQQIKKQVK